MGQWNARPEATSCCCGLPAPSLATRGQEFPIFPMGLGQSGSLLLGQWSQAAAAPRREGESDTQASGAKLGLKFEGGPSGGNDKREGTYA